MIRVNRNELVLEATLSAVAQQTRDFRFDFRRHQRRKERVELPAWTRDAIHPLEPQRVRLDRALLQRTQRGGRTRRERQRSFQEVHQR